MKNDLILNQKVAPNDISTEEALLAGLIIDNKGFKDISNLNSSDFYKSAHKIIFKSMLSLIKKGQTVDLITISNYLTENKNLDEIGGSAYLSYITDCAPIAFNIKSYSKIIKDLSLRRTVISLCMEIIDKGYNTNNTDDFILNSQEKIMNIESSNEKDIFYDMSDLMAETIERIEIVQKLDQDINLDIGMPSLKNAMFVAGSKLIILSARPGMGKTALMLSMSKHLGHQDIMNGILSIEMDRGELADRFLSVESNINTLKFYARNQFDEKGISQLEWFASELSLLPIIVDDAKCNIEDVKRKCRKLKTKGCKIIFIDQLSKISYPSKMSEFQGYSRNCAELALLKKELRIPIVLLCQIGRKVEERGNKRPKLSDLKQTGQIEEDADMIFFLYRGGYYNPDRQKKDRVDESRTEIRLAKNRNGGLGIEHQVTFNKKRAMFNMGF